MSTMRPARPWLFLIISMLGLLVFALAFIGLGRPVAMLLLRLGLTGAWAKSAFYVIWVLTFLILHEAATRAAGLCAGLPHKPGSARRFVFFLGFFLVIGAWLLAARLLAPLLRPHVFPVLAGWLDLLLLLVGGFTIAALADHLGRRLGILVKSRRRT